MTTLNLNTEISELPTELWSEEPPLESDLHLQQIILLLTSLEWLWQQRQDYYASGNLTIYYNAEQLKQKDFCGPDFFVVLNTEKRPRKSWVVWGEGGKYPDVIVEILSDSTASVDHTKKKELYQNTFRTANYFWFDPNSLEFQGFKLMGERYEGITPNGAGWLWSEKLGLYLGIRERKLRYFTSRGELVKTPEEVAVEERLAKERERAEKERERAAKERERAEKEHERAAKERERAEKEILMAENARLLAKLRELGINPDED